MKLKSIFFSALFLGISASSLQSESSVWKVTKGDETVYLGGTVHALRKQDLPLPREFEEAYNLSDLVFFEIDPRKMEDPQVAMKLLQKGNYQGSKSLKTELNESNYRALADLAAQISFPIQAIEKMKPGLATMIVSVAYMDAKLGVDKDGVEMRFARRAEKDDKLVKSLETIEFQMDMIVDLAGGIEDEFVAAMIEDIDNYVTEIDVLMKAWREGDIDTLGNLFIKPMKQFPTVYESLITDRNKNWIPQIEDMFETPEVEFVMVGAGHLCGDEGVIELLKDKGYTIQQIATAY